MQRVWLTAEQHGLLLQPEMTPLIFYWYAQAGQPLSSKPRINQAVERLAEQLDGTLGEEVGQNGVLLCRIGHSRPVRARSTRLPLERLWQDAGA